MDDSTTKRCSTCGETKPLTSFYRNASKPDGHVYNCKACRLVVWKRSKANPNRHPRKWKTPLNPGDSKPCNVCGAVKPAEQFRKEHRDYGDGYYNQCHDCERAKGREWSRQRKEYCREYRISHRDRQRETARAWGKRNHEHVLARRRTWSNTPEQRLKSLLKTHQRRVTKNGTVTPEQVAELMERQKICYYCKKPFNSRRKPTIDHVIPLAKGGQHDISNLVLACLSCNTRKQAHLIRLL